MADDDDKRWDDAVDWLLNSRHTADPDIQGPFWAYVEGHITRQELDIFSASDVLDRDAVYDDGTEDQLGFIKDADVARKVVLDFNARQPVRESIRDAVNLVKAYGDALRNLGFYIQDTADGAGEQPSEEHIGDMAHNCGCKWCQKYHGGVSVTVWALRGHTQRRKT